MKKIILFLYLTSLVYSQELYDFPINRVLDGDTVEINVNFLPKELGDKLYVRIWGVDTPEKGWRAKSQYESSLGLKATEFTKQKIKDAKEIKIQIIMWDKFGGRVLGDVFLDGVSLRKLLLENGFAREYYGTKKQSWDEN